MLFQGSFWEKELSPQVTEELYKWSKATNLFVGYGARDVSERLNSMPLCAKHIPLVGVGARDVPQPILFITSSREAHPSIVGRGLVAQPQTAPLCPSDTSP